MNTRRLISGFLIIALVLFSSACGWRLRGVESKSENSSASAQEELNKQQTKSSANSQSTVISKTATNGIAEQNVSAEKSNTTSVKEDHSGIRLVMQQRNHGLAAAINRKAWENKFTFSDSGRTWLVVENEKLEKRPLTVTETGVAAQYQLILTISFSQRKSNGDVVTPTQQIVSWRSYDFDAKLIVAKAQEEEALIVEMREELAQRMLSLVQK